MKLAMDEFNYYQTIFFQECEKRGLDLEALAALCQVINVTPTFDGFDLALQRLDRILPLVKHLLAEEQFADIDRWHACVQTLLPEIESSWFKQTVAFSVPLRQNSAKRLGSSHKDHELFGALIVRCSEKSNEKRLIKLMAYLITILIRQIKEPEKISFSQSRTVVLCDALCKATIRGTAWEKTVFQLVAEDGHDPHDDLALMLQRCLRFKEDANFEYKQGQIDFSGALKNLVLLLLDKFPKRKNPDSPVNPPILTPPQTKEEDSEESGFCPTPIFFITDKPDDSDNFDTEGLLEDDVDIFVPIVCTTPVTTIDELPSIGKERRTALYTRFYTELDNQYLPICWTLLNQYEIAEVVNYIRSDLGVLAPKTERVSQLIIALTLATGQTLEALLDFRYETRLVKRNDGKNWFYEHENRFYWAHTIPYLSSRYKPSDQEKIHLNEVFDWIVLPFPDLVCRLMLQFKNRYCQSETLQNSLEIDPESIEAVLRTQFNQFRSERTNRSTLKRLRDTAFQAFIRAGGDEIAAYTLLGVDYDRPVSGLYYTTFNTADLVNQYQRAVYRLFSEHLTTAADLGLKGPEQIGSALSIPIENIRMLTSELKQRCLASLKGSRNLNKIIQAHNDFATYTVMMLMFTTGHRAVNDPFYSSDTFLPEINAVIITDKIELVEHEGRLVWLGDRSVEQLQAYRAHLDGLVSALAKYQPGMASAIQERLTQTDSPTIPFFFYLSDSNWQSIKPARLKSQLGGIWPLPINANRHFLATQLRQLGVPTEYINYQLGHVQLGQLPFGRFSALAPGDVRNQLIPALTHLESVSGWECLKGIQTYGQPAQADIPKLSLNNMTFGPELRLKSRVSAFKENVKAVRHAIRNVKNTQNSAFDKEITQDFIDQVMHEIAASSVGASAKIRRHNIFSRGLKIGRLQKFWRSPVPGMMIEMKGEKAPLASEDGVSLQWLNQFKHALVRLIADEFNKKVFPPDFSTQDNKLQIRYWALLRMSAMAFGQLINLDYLNQLEQAVIHHTHVHDDKLWVNFEQEISANRTVLRYRWIPDELSTITMMRFHLIERSNYKPPCPSLINREQIRLAKLIVARAGMINHFDQKNPLEVLVSYIKKDNVLHFPGFVRAVLNNDTRSYPLYESAFRRLMVGQLLVENDERWLNETDRSNRKLFVERSGELQQEFSALKALKSKITSAQSSSSGMNPEQTTENESQRRKQLIDDLADWHAEWGEHCSLTLYFLYQWILVLLGQGTRTKKDLKLSTIQQYVNAISTSLLEQCCDINLTVLDEDELIQVYTLVIDAGVEDNRSYRAKRLAEFHHFLIIHFDAVPIEIGELDPGATEYGADANIVLPKEYQTAFELLLQDPFATKDQQILQALIACLSYRGGLRPSEVVRLLISDVLIEPLQLTYIRNNRFGTTKTVNGVRQVPFYDRLTAQEAELYQYWHQERRKEYGHDRLAPFFSRRLRDQEIVIRRTVVNRINQALRLATGDSAISFRNLRHSFATLFTLCSLQPENRFMQPDIPSAWSGCQQEVGKAMTQQVFGQRHSTRKLLYQLATFMGHGSPEVTIQNYIHCIDILTATYRPKIPKVLSATEIFNLLGYSILGMRTQLKRLDLSAKTLELNDIVPYFVEKNAPKILKVRVNRGDARKSLQLPELEANKSQPELDMLAAILIDYAKGASVTKLANHYFFETSEIQRWVDNAIRIQKESGYKRFGLMLENDGWNLLEPILENENAISNQGSTNAAPSPIRNYINQTFVSELQCAINLNIDSLIHELTYFWSKAYQRQSTGYYLHQLSEVARLIDLLNVFGVEKERFFLEIPKNAKEYFEQRHASILDWFAEQGCNPKNIRFYSDTVYVKSDDGMNLLNMPGFTIATNRSIKLDDVNSENNYYFTTEFISYYLFLAKILIS